MQCPTILYAFGQNIKTDPTPYQVQIQNIKEKVKENQVSKTIEKTADEMLGFDASRIFVYGYAFTSQKIEANQTRGIKMDNKF